MRILIVSQYFWPENVRINDLSTELVGRGHQVTVLTGYPNYPDGSIFADFKSRPREFSRFGEITIVRVPLIARGRGLLELLANYLSFAVSASVMGLWKLRDHECDVVFVFGLSPVTVGIPAAALRAARKAPIVFWVLDLWPESIQAITKARFAGLTSLAGWLVRWIYARCDLILAQSRGFIPSIAKYCSPDSNIRYFPNWAEPLFEQVVRSVPAPELALRPHCFTVLFAGNVGEAQDFPAILDAASLLAPDERIRWVILGGGRMSSWVKGEVKRRGLAERFLMLGQFPVERMPSFFVHADALLVSLKQEPVFSLTIPGKMQAYLASGVPVLAMLDGEGAAVVRQSGAGLACPAGDSAGLAKAVRLMASMTPEQRTEMGNRGRDVTAREFNRIVLIDQLESWLEQLHSRVPLSDETLVPK